MNRTRFNRFCHDDSIWFLELWSKKSIKRQFESDIKQISAWGRLDRISLHRSLTKLFFPGFDASSQGEIFVRLPPPVGLLRGPIFGEGPQSDGASDHDPTQVLAQGPLTQGGHVSQWARRDFGRYWTSRVSKGKLNYFYYMYDKLGLVTVCYHKKVFKSEYELGQMKNENAVSFFCRFVVSQGVEA